MADITNTQHEMAYSDSLEAVATGLTRDETFTALLDAFPSLEAAALREEMDGAFHDALRTGVEPEDVDGSWFA